MLCLIFYHSMLSFDVHLNSYGRHVIVLLYFQAFLFLEVALPTIDRLLRLYNSKKLFPAIWIIITAAPALPFILHLCSTASQSLEIDSDKVYVLTLKWPQIQSQSIYFSKSFWGDMSPHTPSINMLRMLIVHTMEHIYRCPT